VSPAPIPHSHALACLCGMNLVIIFRMLSIWQIDCDWSQGKIERHLDILSAQERERAERFIRQEHRRTYAVSHIVLRLILAQALSCQARDLLFCADKHGKPTLVSESGVSPLQFNLSHSAEKALVAVSTLHPVGADIEQVRRQANLRELAQRFFSQQEQAALENVEGDQAYRRAFYRAWTRKEAFLKAVGVGIVYGLDRFSVDVSPSPQADWLSAPDEHKSYQLIVPDHGESEYEMAIVIEGEQVPWQYDKWR